MPAINTMIHDLQTKTLTGVTGLGWLGAKGAKLDRDLSQAYRVKELSRPVKLGISDPPTQTLTATDAPMWGDAQYLMFEDTWSTIADLNRTYRAVIGGGYSGCLYSVYKAPGGIFKCVHTARSNDNAMSSAMVSGIRSYAADQRWTLIHEVTTAGIVDQVGSPAIGAKTVFLATRVDYTISPNPIVRTVRLPQNPLGATVGNPVEWNTPS